MAEHQGEQRAALEEAYAINPQSEQVRQDFAELGLPVSPLAATAPAPSPAYIPAAPPSNPQYAVPPAYAAGGPPQPYVHTPLWPFCSR